jgi:hypothetical protein
MMFLSLLELFLLRAVEHDPIAVGKDGHPPQAGIRLPRCLAAQQAATATERLAPLLNPADRTAR